jgi:hypothetical protein
LDTYRDPLESFWNELNKAVGHSVLELQTALSLPRKYPDLMGTLSAERYEQILTKVDRIVRLTGALRTIVSNGGVVDMDEELLKLCEGEER